MCVLGFGLVTLVLYVHLYYLCHVKVYLLSLHFLCPNACENERNKCEIQMPIEPQDISQLLSTTTGEDEGYGPNSVCYTSEEFNSCLNTFNSHS